MPQLEDPQLELYCQERAKIGATDFDAYKAAGFQLKKSAADHMLSIVRDTKVSARIAELHVAAALVSNVTPERTIQKLARMAFVDIGKAVKQGAPKVWADKNKITGAIRIVFTPGRETMVDISELDDDTAAAITNVRLHKNGAITYTLESSMAALVLLGKHVGMWPKETRQGLSARSQASNSYQGAPQDPAAEPIPPNETREQWIARARRRMDRLRKRETPTEGGGLHGPHSNEPLIYVDAPPSETAEEWEARQRRRLANESTN